MDHVARVGDEMLKAMHRTSVGQSGQGNVTWPRATQRSRARVTEDRSTVPYAHELHDRSRAVAHVDCLQDMGYIPDFPL